MASVSSAGTVFFVCLLVLKKLSPKEDLLNPELIFCFNWYCTGGSGMSG